MFNPNVDDGAFFSNIFHVAYQTLKAFVMHLAFEKL